MKVKGCEYSIEVGGEFFGCLSSRDTSPSEVRELEATTFAGSYYYTATGSSSLLIISVNMRLN